jgi:hypothetical protein
MKRYEKDEKDEKCERQTMNTWEFHGTSWGKTRPKHYQPEGVGCHWHSHLVTLARKDSKPTCGQKNGKYTVKSNLTHIPSGNLTQLLNKSFPIGSMVRVYLLTFGVY